MCLAFVIFLLRRLHNRWGRSIIAAGVVSVACIAAIMVGIVGRSADEQLHPVSVGVSWETNRYVKNVT
jgi:hypothetical protein